VVAAEHADPPATAPVLETRELSVEFPRRGGEPVRAVNGVSLSLRARSVLAVLGESGSGKSMLLRTVLGIQPARARVAGQVLMRGQDLLAMPETERARTRGAWLSMVFQNPMTALDPVFTVEEQLVQPMTRHTRIGREAARKRALDLLRLVQISSPERRLRAYPFELSGGMRQRVAIAMALACDASVLLADEPTTALDVTVQARILDLLRSVRAELGTSVVLVTHDVGVAAEIADEIAVMYAGRVVERGPVREVLGAPAHPYTQGLLRANVRAGQRERPTPIPGSPPNLAQLPPGCSFQPRCALARAVCAERVPELHPVPGTHQARCVLTHAVAGTADNRGDGEDAKN
jgi:oligopeptide/dipeptide ABC transporter ATP-binding protein